ncbi:alginate export family protein [Cellvibrio fontiphilus]|uniref:Alginate export family protein n=1 Tax=Cellvibrio fontiphilus TaxID=1815559 RepID=A0ABV7FH74_9GAMM
MKKNTLHLLVAAVSSLVCSVPNVSAKTFTESMQQGSVVKINFRTRFEDVTEDVLGSDSDREANAWTTRSRISYQSGVWNGFGFSAEMDNVSEMTNDHDYRTSAANVDPLWADRNTVAVIADPTGTEVNQAFVSYTTFNNQVKYGRQRLLLDNSRFIGNVGWRQNEQTYDGISWTNKSIRYTNFTYAYIKNVNRVFGEDNPVLGDLHMDSHVLNASYTGFDAGKLIGYAYLLDVNDPVSQLGLTGDTFGVRWQGTVGESFLYNLEYAKQQDAGAAQQYDADYGLAEVVYNINRYSFTLGYEELGSDDGAYGFATPLATLHAFQGWADKFLATPAAGLQDIYFNLGVTIGGAQALLSYHKFDSSEGSIDFGDEIDFSLSKKIGAVVLTGKLAQYSMGDSNANYSDTTKYWLMADWNF